MIIFVFFPQEKISQFESDMRTLTDRCHTLSLSENYLKMSSVWMEKLPNGFKIHLYFIYLSIYIHIYIYTFIYTFIYIHKYTFLDLKCH